MAFIPTALQLLPLIPSLVDNVLKIIKAVKADPATPAEVKANLDDLDRRLTEAVERVRQAPLPA